MSGLTYHLNSQLVRERAKVAIDNAAPGSVVKVGGPRRTLDQNDKMHAIFTDVARSKWSSDPPLVCSIQSVRGSVVIRRSPVGRCRITADRRRAAAGDTQGQKGHHRA